MTNYDCATHLNHIREVYREKAKLLLELAERHLASDITWEPIGGGLFLWYHPPDDTDITDFYRKAMKRTVRVVPGSAFLVSETQPCQLFRINYTVPTDEQLTKGTEILGQLARELRTK